MWPPGIVALMLNPLLKQLAEIKVWKRGGQRAPQKPLLLLLTFARVRRGEDRWQPYAAIEPKMKELLERFGPSRQSHRPIQPFLRLPHDGLWEIPEIPDHAQLSSRDIDKISPDELRSRSATGGLPEEIYHALRNDDGMLQGAVRFLLNNEFPESYHQDLLEAVDFGDLDPLELVRDSTKRRRRDPTFRGKVITAYEHCCAICSYDIRIDNQLLGLEAAHILWHSEGGPDEVPNGLALCSLHHKALDRGGISISDDLKVLVSSELHGREAAKTWFLEYAGKQIRDPRDNQNRPNLEYLDWHRREVFRQ